MLDILESLMERRLAEPFEVPAIDPKLLKLFTEHAITPEIGARRPYIAYDQGDFEKVIAVYATFNALRFAYGPRTKEEAATVVRDERLIRKLVKQSSGVVMVRHRYGGVDYRFFEDKAGNLRDFNPAAIFELRPDKPIATRGPRHHFHPSGLLDDSLTGKAQRNAFYRRLREEGRWPYYPVNNPKRCKRCGEELSESLFYGGTKEKPKHRYRTPGGKMRCLTPAQMLERHWRQDEQGRWQSQLPKSAIEPAERVEKHIKRAKDDSDHRGVYNEEVHAHQRFAKYVFMAGDTYAKCLDIHPNALEGVFLYPRIEWVMEGCIKADAVLSAIFEEDERASVVSNASVTLWDSGDLSVFLNRLFTELERDTPPEIVLGPDADWFENPAVLTQALLLRSRLRVEVEHVCIAAPFARDWLEPCKCKPFGRTTNGLTCANCGGYFKGVDDFLVAGGKLGDRIVLHREAPLVERLAALLHVPRKTDTKLRMAHMLHHMAEHADINGDLYPSVEKLAAVSGFPKRTAYNVADYLVEDKLITAHGSTSLKPRKYVKKLRREVGSFDFEERPTFTLPEHLRANPFQFFRLKHWQNPEKEDMDKRNFEQLDLNARMLVLEGRQDRLEQEVKTLKGALRLSDEEIAKTVDMLIADAFAVA